jgi:hypothetical protein
MGEITDPHPGSKPPSPFIQGTAEMLPSLTSLDPPILPTPLTVTYSSISSQHPCLVDPFIKARDAMYGFPVTPSFPGGASSATALMGRATGKTDLCFVLH